MAHRRPRSSRRCQGSKAVFAGRSAGRRPPRRAQARDVALPRPPAHRRQTSGPRRLGPLGPARCGSGGP
eukprot:scaffold257977_cov24-Tisochrysis_lutea.AAC.1